MKTGVQEQVRAEKSRESYENKGAERGVKSIWESCEDESPGS